MIGRRRIVVLGMMSKMPVAGAVWQTVQYLLGFTRLGYETYYVEAHARTPSMFMQREHDDASALAAAFIDRVARRFGLGDRWAFHALHADGRCYGLSAARLREVYRSAELIVNLHGGTVPRPEHHETACLVHLETDPVEVEVQLANGDERAAEFLAPHVAHFTWGLNYGNSDCRVPLPEGTRFHVSPPALLPELWRTTRPAGEAFTTIGNWRQEWRDLVFEGEIYRWSKHHEFLKFVDLPHGTNQPFELALASYEADDQELLEHHGWRVRPSLPFSSDLDAYREYVCGSRAEFTVAKDQNVRLRSGWFSERSASYLAAGRPVVTQDTGFGSMLPTGEGLFAFSTLDEARAAVEAINSDYVRHSRAAAAIASEYFDYRRVLTRLLDEAGAERVRRSRIVPVSRRPVVLPDETVDAVLSRRLPRPRPAPVEEPRATIVVVTHGGLVFTRLCLESVLAHTEGAYELVVVDNASPDDTADYLRALTARDGRVRVLFNEANVGFAAASNQGVDVGRAGAVVLLNSDTIVPPGWLSGLLRHLEDQRVGAVGPVTNRSGTESEIPAEYGTYEELLELAERRARDRAGARLEVGMLTMFCVALRQEVVAAVGPLDPRFGAGTLEDDDYAERLRRAGYQLFCAEDVFVHHFGEASFGYLVATGEYDRLLAENRARFGAKWGEPWRAYARRPDAEYRRLVAAVKAAIDAATPPDATVLVASHGDDGLVELDGRRGWHFPQEEGGVYAGHHPAGSGDAIDRLEELRVRGAEFLVVPASCSWWLDFYDGFRRYLDTRYRFVREDSSCSIVDLRGPELPGPPGNGGQPQALAHAGASLEESS